MRLGEVRDPNLDYILKKVWVAASDVVKTSIASPTTLVPTTLTVGWSFGSPTYASWQGHIGGIRIANTTTQVDYFWRVPSDVDKNHAIYFRHHYVPQIGGATQTVSFNQWYQTVSIGTSITAMSPTQPLNVQIPASTISSGTDGTVDYRYQITGRGSIQPIATGFAASQVMLDTVEAIHTTFQIVSTNFAILSAPVFWMGMDIEYTPRLTYGDGSRREGRKLETNLGYQEVGAANAY